MTILNMFMTIFIYDNLKMFRAIQACLRLSKHFYENFK